MPLSGLRGIPRIEDLDAETGEVFYVARDDREFVFNGGRGNHAVRRVEGRSFQLALTIQHAPAVGDGMGDGQDAVTKPDQEASLKPRLQLGAAEALGKHDEPPADFTNRDGAEKEHRYGLGFEPLHNARLWTIPAEFRWDVGVV